MGTEKIFIPLRRSVPAFILDKLVVRTGSWSVVSHSGDRLEEARSVFFIFSCRLTISPNDRLIIKGFLTARLTALEQTIIALRVKQPLLVKARLLKAVVNIRGDDKIIFVLYQLQKIIVDRFGASI